MDIDAEKEALKDLSMIDDPLARVIYHMSQRQLDMCERLVALSSNMDSKLQEIETLLITMEGRVRRIERATTGMSNPMLEAVKLDG